jgi:hypothetical protein
MSKPVLMKIDDVEYVRKDSLCTTDTKVQIFVLDRGFVYIGTSDGKTPDGIVIKNAHNIRVWGTTKGLGELVSGPTSKTVLDKVGTVRVPIQAIISIIDVDSSKWNLF